MRTLLADISYIQGETVGELVFRREIPLLNKGRPQIGIPGADLSGESRLRQDVSKATGNVSRLIQPVGNRRFEEEWGFNGRRRFAPVPSIKLVMP